MKILFRPVTALRLGRVSNLPTVWSNVLAAVALGGSDLRDTAVLVLLVAFSLFYIGGMYLNDACDAAFDRQFRPERPIPKGEVSRPSVLGTGFVMLTAGLFLLTGAGGWAWQPFVAGLALAATIIIYDAWHKGNPVGPALMALCRSLVYVGAGAAVAPLPAAPVWAAASVSLCYVIGLTYAAKQEYAAGRPALWPFALLVAPFVWGLAATATAPLALVPMGGLAVVVAYALAMLRLGGPEIGRGVAALIAGISLVDAIYLMTAGSVSGGVLCMGAFALTLALQRVVPGT